jgi:hypothetical protein
MMTLPDATAEVPKDEGFSSKSLKYKIRGSRQKKKKKDAKVQGQDKDYAFTAPILRIGR